jgi:succinate dehydrogenase / fumarate reductase cytochrome b subunit
MSWLTKTLTSTIGRKLIMSLTGIFLVLFLVVHLAGNLQLLKDDGGMAFNIYAKFMTSNPLIKTTSYLLYATFLIHIFLSLRLTIQNRKARGSVGYAVNGAAKSVTWNSKNMGLLGTIVFIFLVIHMRNFWYEMHWGGIQMVSYDGESYKDLYSVVSAAFGEPLYVIGYVIAMFGLAFHLYHGFQSSFQSLGINHKKYTPAIKFVGVAFSILVPGLFAIIPIYMFLI